MRSKLFNPSSSTPKGCFVNPPDAPTVSSGFADAEGGGAMYPLRLNGGGGSEQNPPKKAAIRTSDDFDPE